MSEPIVLGIESTCDETAAAVAAGADEVDVFPAWETLPFERVSPSVETMGRRMRTMWHLRDPERSPKVLVAPARALVQRLGPHVDETAQRLVKLGGERPELFHKAGLYAEDGTNLAPALLDAIARDVPIMALTATATPKVQQDILKNLEMSEDSTFVSSFNRDNLYYEIQPKIKKEQTIKSMVKFIVNFEGKSGIIYTLNRKTTEELAEVPTVCGSLREALDSLAADHDFLLKGDVFTKDQIEAYIELKREDVARWEMAPSPVEFDMYYSS